MTSNISIQYKCCDFDVDRLVLHRNMFSNVVKQENLKLTKFFATLQRHLYVLFRI